LKYKIDLFCGFSGVFPRFPGIFPGNLLFFPVFYREDNKKPPLCIVSQWRQILRLPGHFPRSTKRKRLIITDDHTAGN
jgi:hypothetical protein